MANSIKFLQLVSIRGIVHEKNVIRDVTLNITRGEKIALIGSSGAGNSTLLNLLSGLYTPDTATLCIDGNCFQSLEALHAITTLIPPEPEIFENTIAFNITMNLRWCIRRMSRMLLETVNE